jgi:hypothetical protein
MAPATAEPGSKKRHLDIGQIVTFPPCRRLGLLTILQGHRTLADVSVMQWNSKTSTYRPAAPVGPTR